LHDIELFTEKTLKHLLAHLAMAWDSDLYKSRGWVLKGPFKGQKRGNFDKYLKIFFS